MTETLGQVIRQLRKEAGFNLKELEAKTGITQGFLTHIELGKKNPSIENIIKIANALGVSKLYLYKAAGYLDGTDILKLVDENKCLREALNTIATRKMSCYLSVQHMNEDFIKIANQALGGETN